MKTRITTISVGLALIVGIGLTVWGLFHTSWKDASWAHLPFMLASLIVIAAGSTWARTSPLIVGATVASLVTLVSGATWPLLVTLWFALASTLLGKWCLRKLSAETDSWVLQLLAGAGLYGTGVGLLAHLPANYPGVYGVTLALPIMLNWRAIVEQGKDLLDRGAQRTHTGSGTNGLDTAISVVALVYVVVSLMPEVSHDALAMHLFIPAHLAARHQWGFDPGTYVWAVMPMMGDWIFAVGYMLAGETAARLINVGFIFVLGSLVRDLVLWAGGSTVGARWAVLIFLSTPLTHLVGGSLFVESVWAAFAVAGTLTILRSCSTSGVPRFDLPLAGVLLACAVAAKAIAFTVLPVLLFLLASRYRSWCRAVGLPSLLLAAGLFITISSIPYLTAWWMTSNPVFPFFNHVFRSPYYPDAPVATGFGKGLPWHLLYTATFESWIYLEAKAGASGFQWLLLFAPAAVGLLLTGQRRGTALLLIGALEIATVFQSQTYLRYAFPGCAILAAAIGVALSAEFSRRTLMNTCLYAVAGVTVTLNLLFVNAGGSYGDFPLKSVLDASSRERYLLHRLPIRNAVELVNHLNRGRTPVAVFASPIVAGLSANALHTNWYNPLFHREVNSARTEHAVSNVLLERGVEFVILDSAWTGGPGRIDLIKHATDDIAEFGSISVRRIKTASRTATELLSNPDFTSTADWSFSPEATYDAGRGIILASVTSPVTQVVTVTPGRRYLNAVVARCGKEPALGRVQINWLGGIKGEFIGTNIETYECSTTWAQHAMEVTAPPNAVQAVVYVTGHSPIPLEFKSNSLRRRP